MSWTEGGATDPAGGITFHERGRASPSSRLPPEIMPGPPAGASFSPDGVYATWGNSDGTVAVCNLTELGRRLGEAGMGW